MALFANTRIHIPETIPRDRFQQIVHVIRHNGGEIVPLPNATHIVTNTLRFFGVEDVRQGVYIVKDIWVDRCMVLGELLSPELYSVEPGKIFSGVVATASGMSSSDLVILRTGILSLGGTWRTGLTREVTHLFATSPNSEKYAAAMEHQPKTGMKILLPHWFDDAVRIGSGQLSTGPYEWPEPNLLKSPLLSEKPDRKNLHLSTERQQYFKTAIWHPEHNSHFPALAEPTGEDIWKQRRILLSRSIGLDDTRRRVVEDAITTAGGHIVRISEAHKGNYDDKEYEKIGKCDVYITRWRAGRAFVRAVEEVKIIGTLNWVLFVHATQTVSSPMDQLLHFPVRKVPVAENFAQQRITVTNFAGGTREYLKALIKVMGAEYTASMTGTNTILIAAHMGGIKTEKALAWSIPVVNHVWLENCFTEWRFIHPAVSKYIEFPPHVDFTPMLGERGLALTAEELLATEEEQEDGRAPNGTEASAKEVEGILSAGDIEEAVDIAGKSKTARLVPASVSPTKPRVAREGATSNSSKRLADADDSPSKKRPMDETAQPPTPKRLKTYGKRRTLFSEGEESDTDQAKPSRKEPISREKKGSSSKRKALSDVEPDESSSESPPPRKRARTTTKSRTVSGKANGNTTSSRQEKVAGRSGNLILSEQRSHQQQEVAEEEEVSNDPEATGSKHTQRIRSRKTENSVQTARQPATKAQAKGSKRDAPPRTTRSSLTEIRMLTTITELDKDIIKKLTKLGVKTANSVADCTHLIAPSIVRTEKFLCALANGAWLLSTDWANKSAAANKLLPEDDYILSDKANEKKWGIKLTKSMERAKTRDGKLFDGYTFFITPKVASIDLLRTVVEAQGGKTSTTKPTIRMINSYPNHYLISCPEDKAIWKQIAAKRRIFTQEVIIVGSLHQKLDFDNPEFVLAGEDEDNPDLRAL